MNLNKTCCRSWENEKNQSIINKLYKSSVVGFIAAAVAALLGVLIDGIVIGAIVTVPLFILAKPVAAAFGNKDGAEMVALAARGIRIYSVSIILYSLNNAFVNYMQGLRGRQGPKPRHPRHPRSRRLDSEASR